MAEETTFWRKLRLISLGLNIVFIPAFFILLYYFVRCRQGFSCDDCLDKKKITVIDTLQSEPAKLKTVFSNIPKPVQVLKTRKFIHATHYVADSSFSVKEKCLTEGIGILPGASVDTDWQAYNNCDELRIYQRDTTLSDTTYESRFRKVILRIHNYRIVARDTVLGELVGGKISYENLDPVTVTKITKFEKEKIHLYVGISGTYNGWHKDRWGLGPSIGLSLPKIGQFGYYYDGHNNAHTFNLQYQVRFFK